MAQYKKDALSRMRMPESRKPQVSIVELEMGAERPEEAPEVGGMSNEDLVQEVLKRDLYKDVLKAYDKMEMGKEEEEMGMEDMEMEMRKKPRSKEEEME